VKLVLTTTLLLWTYSFAFTQNDTSKLVWPPPPDQPRIMHVRTIATLQSIKGEGGFFSKILGFFFGENSSSHWLVQPVGIAISPRGELYIADPGANGIHVIDQERREYDFIAQTKFGAFHAPVGIAFAPDGTIFISDSQRGDIIAVDEDHDAKFQVRDHLVRPTGLLVLQDKLYVVDASLQKIVVFDLKGKYLFDFGGRGEETGKFNYPIQITGTTSLYIVDALNYRIQQFSADGKFISAFGKQGTGAGSFASPKAVATDSDGNVYVTDALMDNVQIFNPRGQLLLVVGQQGERDGQFMSPGGIAIDGNNNIFIVDMLNRRIQIFRYLK